MLKERLRSMILGPGDSASLPKPLASSGPPKADLPVRPKAAQSMRHDNQVYTRNSHGLNQFFGHIESQTGLSILDLAGITQANVAFITNLGHRLYSEDFLRTLFETFGSSEEEFVAGQSDPQQIDSFLAQNLDFPEEFFDAVLVWDALEFLAPPLLKATVVRLLKIVKPGCYVLAFFHAEEKPGPIPAYSYRIADSRTLHLTPYGTRHPVQLFNNRGIEKLFQQFNSVKFFLARDHLREVIVTR